MDIQKLDQNKKLVTSQGDLTSLNHQIEEDQKIHEVSKISEEKVSLQVNQNLTDHEKTDPSQNNLKETQISEKTVAQTKSTQQEGGTKNLINMPKEHMGNQSTDCDDIINQFKNNQQQLSMNKKPQEDGSYFTSESDDQQIKGRTIEKSANQIITSQNEKLQKDHNQKSKKQDSNSSSPSSTSSEDEKLELIKKKSGSHSSLDSQTHIKIQTAVPQLQNINTFDVEEEKQPQSIPENMPQKNLQTPEDDHKSPQLITERQPVQQTEEEKKCGQVSGSDLKKTSSDDSDDSDDDDDDGDDDDDEPNQSQSSFVVEMSPRGRFNRFGEELGRGAYKIVYKGVDNETGREIAWNVINLNRLPKQDRIRIKSEIDLIKKLQDKHIIHFISAWVNKLKEQVIFITEMITGGSLRKYVKKIKHPRLRVIKGWCTEILQGLVYLHEQKPHPIIHRDLKCDNIFINSNSGEIRIGDLGLSTPMQNSYTTSVLGTPEFMAPELYEECYGTSVDIYAFGMCVLEMITLERPYQECQNPAQIYSKVVQGIRPKALERIEDEEVKDFILQCLCTADRRPAAKDLLESKFIKDIESDKNNREVKVRPPTKQKGPKKKKSLQYMKKHGSTILEEEEENNSDDDQEARNAVHQQIQQSIEQECQSQGTSVHHQSTTEVTVATTNQDTKQESLQESVPDNDQSQVKDNVSMSTPISNEVELQGFGEVPKFQSMGNISQTSANALEVEQQPIDKKKKKSGSKNKKLNESVIFLKQIDKEKQKKMQERTRIGQKDDNNDDEQNSSLIDESDKEDVKIQDIMLRELLDQDLEYEKLQFEQAQQQQLKNDTMQDLPKLQLKSLPAISHQQFYDSSDQNNRTPINNTNVENFNKDAMTVKSQGYDHSKRDKKDFVCKGKNFKEDAPPNKMSISTQPRHVPKQQQLGQDFSKNNATANSGAPLNDELKRTNSKDYQPQHHHFEQQQLKNYQQYQPTQHEQKIKVQNQQFYHQGSDSHLSSQSATTSIIALQQSKFNHGGSHVVEHTQNQESLFDVQSSDDENNQSDCDSEVDCIQLPKTQVDEAGYNNTRSQPNTPQYDQSNNSNTNSKLQTEGIMYSHLKKGGTTKQLYANQPQHQQFNSVKSQFAHPPHQQSQQKQQHHVETQKSFPKAMPLPDQKQNYSQSQPHQQSKPRIDKVVVNNHTPTSTQSQQVQKTSSHQLTQIQQNSHNRTSQPQQYQHQVYLHSSIRVDDKPYLHRITFKVRSYDGTQDKEVFFEFDVRSDTAKGVAEEMVKELYLPSSQIQVIEDLIKSSIQEPQKIVQKVPESAHQQLPAPNIKKDSPTKISKDQANTYFNKVFENIDSYFLYMQSKNISTIEEITESMELPQEEAQIRLTFLKELFQLKRTYKKSVEEHKKKLDMKKKQSLSTQNSDLQIKPKISNETKPPQSSNKQLVQQSQVIPQSQQFQSQQQIPQKKSTPTLENNLKRVSSNQDVPQLLSYQEERKDFSYTSPPQKIQYNIPSYVRKQFKTAPTTINIHSKLSANLKRMSEVNYDDEVVSLQHMLNLIFEVSVIQMMQAKDNKPETQQIIQNYIPLRIDGYFGDKNEAQVIKFQKHIKTYEDGIVTDQLWFTLLSYVDHIVKEDLKKQAQIQQQHHNNHYQQAQPQQMQKEYPKNNPQQVINTAAQVQLITVNQPISKQPTKVQSHPQVNYQHTQPLINQKSIQQSNTTQNSNQHQQRISPNKYQAKKNVVQDIDYQSAIEQAFPPRQNQDDQNEKNKEYNDEDDEEN